LRVPLEWLEEYVDLTLEPADLADLLTNAGTAVEGIEIIGGELKGFAVGHVLEVQKHPLAEKLSVCRVDVGVEELNIVCGAPNVREGVKVAVAPPGTLLPDGSRIKEVSIRGVASRGMMLSEKELGISDDAQGIMVLDEECVAGEDLARALGMPHCVLVLEVTPNRPDCLCMIGVAREVAALTGKRLKKPSFSLKESEKRTDEAVRVEIVDADLCTRYAARVIDKLAIGPSPWFMRRRLLAAGVRPISNVVDITNYVMLETGQPLHAFDYRLVEEGHIIVRRAREGEILTTLDGVQRTLRPQDLLICDPSGPIALAGIMGGEHSEVSDSTSCVLLESAHFESTGIMRTSRQLELSSEASYRFERGVDPNGCVYAANRAAYLMQELAGGEVLAGVVDERARAVEPVNLRLRVNRTGRLIGIPLRLGEAKDLLESIDMEIKGIEKEEEEEIIEVAVPTYRPDLEREIDLVEEIARLYGYGRITPTLPETSNNVGGLSAEQKLRRRIAEVMTALGLNEAITLSLISPRWLDLLDRGRDYLPESVHSLRNPISEETSILRPSLLPGLLDALRFNLNRRVMDVSLYEIGRVFMHRKGSKQPDEPLKLAFVLSGDWIPKQWDREAEKADFFTAKGLLEALVDALSIRRWSMERKEYPFLHPARSCCLLLEGREAGCLGMIHPMVAKQADLPAEIAMLEVDVGRLVECSLELGMYEEVPRFPSIQMDIAVVVKEDVPSREVEKVIKDAGGELLREVRLFDLYRGSQIGEGEKSLAYSLTFYALDRTLKDREARGSYEAIVKALGEKLHARLR
jgi:phenylalanyl-tRNA synthetase beta chain